MPPPLGEKRREGNTSSNSAKRALVCVTARSASCAALVPDTTALVSDAPSPPDEFTRISQETASRTKFRRRKSANVEQSIGAAAVPSPRAPLPTFAAALSPHIPASFLESTACRCIDAPLSFISSITVLATTYGSSAVCSDSLSVSCTAALEQLLQHPSCKAFRDRSMTAPFVDCFLHSKIEKGSILLCINSLDSMW
jgi:hypothetical protein